MKRLIALLLSLAAASCQPPPPVSPPSPPVPPAPTQSALATPAALEYAPTPDAAFRQNPPAPGAEAAWQAPVPEEGKLSNGMRVLVITRSKLPIVVVNLTTRHGADLQPSHGLGSFVGEMLDEGTTTRSALQLSDEFENIGAIHQSWMDWDAAGLWVQALSQHFDRALELTADMVQNPRFDPADVDRVRSQRLATLAQQADIPQVILQNTIVRVTYGNHPYGQPLIGNAEAVKKVDQKALRAYWASRFTPSEMVAVVVGDVTREDAIAKLEKTFGGWKRKAATPRPLPPPPKVAPGIVIVDRPGAAQANIAFAGVGVPRTSPDFDPLMVANTILGGMFSSRLNLNLRERHGWTYGARSGFDMRHGPGPFTASAAVDSPNAVPAIKEMIDELDRFAKAPVTDDELTLAKGTLIKSLPGRFESDSAAATSIAWLGVYGLPLDEYRTRPERFQKVTAADVQAMARKHFDRGKMRVVVVGDRKALEPELKKLGIGAVTVVDAEGKPVK